MPRVSIAQTRNPQCEMLTPRSQNQQRLRQKNGAKNMWMRESGGSEIEAILDAILLQIIVYQRELTFHVFAPMFLPLVLVLAG